MLYAYLYIKKTTFSVTLFTDRATSDKLQKEKDQCQKSIAISKTNTSTSSSTTPCCFQGINTPPHIPIITTSTPI